MRIYKKDYCTCSPDWLAGVYLGDICKKHDEAYALSGNFWDRLKADVDFGRRLYRRAGLLVSFVYFFGVRLFGWIFFYFKKKEVRKRYRKLLKEQKLKYDTLVV